MKVPLKRSVLTIGRFSIQTDGTISVCRKRVHTLEGVADDTQQPEIKTVEDFLDSIENQQLYQILIKVDKLTLQIALMKIQGYSTCEIAHSLSITEKAVYRRMDRLKEKIKKFFE